MTRWKCLFLLVLLLFETYKATAVSANDETTDENSLIKNIPYTNQTEETCDRTCQLEQLLGPSRMDLSYTVSMSLFYLVILITGILGNVITCLVIVFNDNMHTTTNYYLFSLSISDVIFLTTGLPLELHGLFVGAYPWVFGRTMCILRTWVFEATTMCSILTILTFTFERWLHICHPIYAKKFSNSFSRAFKIILVIWIVSGLSAVPFAFTSGVYFASDKFPESKICYTLPQYTELMNGILKLSVTLFFIVPMTLMSVMYILIGIQLWKSQKINRDSHIKRKPKESNPSPSKIRKKLSQKFTLKPPKVKAQNHAQSQFLTVRLENHRKTLKDNTDTESIASSNWSKENIGKLNVKRISMSREQLSKPTRQSRRDVVKMLLFVVLGFFICWAPFHLQRVWTTTLSHESMPALKSLLTLVYYVSGISIYISSVINPILYNVMSERYRIAFANTVRMLFKCQFKETKPNYLNSKLYLYNKKNIENLKHKKREDNFETLVKTDPVKVVLVNQGKSEHFLEPHSKTVTFCRL